MAPNKPFPSLKRRVIKPLPKHQCPGCSRKVFTTAGLTRHIQYHHPGLLDNQDNIRSDPYIPNSEDSSPTSSRDVPPPTSPPVASPSPDIGMSASHPVGSLSQAHGNTSPPAQMHPPSPVPPSSFHHAQSHIPANFSPHADVDDVMDFFPHNTSPLDTLPGRFDSPESPIPSHRGDRNAQSPAAEDAPLPSYSRTYHRNLTGQVCDMHGNDIPPNSPPPPPGPERGPNDWFPYENRIQFELADFLYRRNQMSEGDTDFLLTLMNGLLVAHGDTAPFQNHTDMHSKIDATTLGEAPWESFSLNYNGPLPEGISADEIPSWMTEDYEVWYRDPVTLVENLLANPDFKDGFDYVPYQEHTPDGSHRFHDFMSGNWAWRQADTIIKDYPNATGSCLVTIILGSDKTTVSVATGHTSYWPIYLSIGNIHNSVRKGHRNGVVLLGFLAIPHTDNESRNDVEYRRFRRQLLHTSLMKILESLKPNMTEPRIVRCPDGHYRRVIFSLGPYIADYPEQCLLSSVVQGWCPRCTAPSDDIDSGRFIQRSEAHTELLCEQYELKELWNDYGIVGNVKPFTTYFPRADIHDMLSPDILHQLIKGAFKDHLVTWVNDYIKARYPDKKAKRIMDDIDRRISLAPGFSGLRRFPQGRGFTQWTGDDSKALMKVYLPAIEGYVPNEMVRALQAYLDFCYIARRDVHDTNSLKELEDALGRFHTHREIFQTSGVRPKGFNLPRSHAAVHYLQLIRAFGAPNGLCSSITESKHIKAVKEPWRRSSRWNALGQMLTTNARLDKLAAARADFTSRGMLEGSCLSAVLRDLGLAPLEEEPPPAEVPPTTAPNNNPSSEDDNDDDMGVDSGVIESHVELSKTSSRRVYPDAVDEPDLPRLIQEFICDQQGIHSDNNLPLFYERITIHPCAVATFHAPSDLSGISGMKRERIHAVDHWRRGPGRYDTLFISTDSSAPGILGLEVARAHLFFSFTHNGIMYPCALVHWFSRKNDAPSDITGMWVVEPDIYPDGKPITSVVHLDTVFRAAHLLPVYRNHQSLSRHQRYEQTLDLFSEFYVNRYIDHHTFEVVV